MSRIIISFQKEKIDYRQDQLQAFVYNLIRLAGFEKLHDLHQSLPRFFSFSQLFLTKSRKLNLIIASPIKELIIGVEKVLRENDKFFLADVGLKVLESKIFERDRIFMPIWIKTETPIILRIPAARYTEYRIDLDRSIYPWFYWRPLRDKNVPLEPFIRQLEARVYKLYKLFFKKEIEEKEIFERFVFIKSVDMPYFKDGRKISRIGTIWKLKIHDDISENLVQFILDIGLGELTSQGYGFVNLYKQRF